MEGFARKAGALFVSRLKACTIWDELGEVPLVRKIPRETENLWLGTLC